MPGNGLDRSRIECSQQVLNVNVNGWDFIRVGPHPNSRSRSACLPPAGLVIQVHHLGLAPISMPDITRWGMDGAGVINECIGRPYLSLIPSSADGME